MFSQATKLLPLARSVQYFNVKRCRRDSTSSSLYITGDKTKQSCPVLTPYLNLDLRFKDTASLIKNIESRGMKINLDGLQAGWARFNHLKQYKAELDKVQLQLIAKFKMARKQAIEPSNDLKAEYSKLKENIQIVDHELWDLEKHTVISGLSLPNDLHSETPCDGHVKVVHQFKEKPCSDGSFLSHIDIAEKLGLLEYFDSSYYFLKDKAAHFEMGVSYLFMDKFRDFGFIPMSNSDFVRSTVVEGVGFNPEDPSSVFTMEMDPKSSDPLARLHLVGGASIVSFCAYHTKTITEVQSLPLRYVSIGRHYNPGNETGLSGLFSAWQSSAVESFVIAADEAMAWEEFQICLREAIKIYESLGYHFRVVYLPPKSLRPWESLNASFQMYSMHLKQYIEVGSWSLCDDFISQRLLMCCQTAPDKPLRFNHVISGTAVSVPHLLGCVLENNPNNFDLPSVVADAVM